VIDSIRARKLLVRSFVDDGGKTKQPVMVNQAISSRATESRIPKPSFRRGAVRILISRLWKNPRHLSKSLRNGPSKVRSKVSIRLEEIQWTLLTVRGGDAPPLICSALVRALFLTRTGQRITRPVYWAS